MHIEISTDSRTAVAQEDVIAEIESGLLRFRERITRVEVHLSDENGPKGGTDSRCKLEVRPAGHQPVVVAHDAGSPEDAVSGAVEKMDRLLASAFDRLGETRGGASASGLPT